MPERRGNSLQSYYVWEPPSRGITVLLNLRLVEGMKTWLDQASRSGHEAGGILLGTIEQDSSDQRIVTIEDCAAIRIPHHKGPQFSIAERDARPLENAVVRWRAQKDTNVQPVGFTRSHLRPGLYLDPADFALFWNNFPDPGSVFLLVRPEPETQAGFFFWENGELHRQDSYLPFPFDAAKLTRDVTYSVLRGPTQPPEASPKPRALAPIVTPAPVPAARKMKFSVQPGDGPRLGLIGLTLAILLSAILWAPSTGSRLLTTSSNRSELGLSVDHLGPALRLTWNAHAAVVEGAARGVLWVSDGAVRKKVDLDERQLAHGSAMYVPESDRVEFRLEVAKGGNLVANSILSFAPGMSGATAEGERPSPFAAPPIDPSPAPAQPKARPAVASVVPAPAPAAAPPEPDKSAVAAEQPAAPPPPPPAPTPFVRQALPTVSFNYEYAPLPARPQRKGIDKIPVLRLFHRHSKKEAGASEAEAVVSAKPLQPVKPHVPSEVARAVPGDWRVDVKASIDERGRVFQLEPLSSTADQRLVRLAMSTVNDWDFEPANAGGHAVKSGLLVTFHFHIPAETDSEASAKSQ